MVFKLLPTHHHNTQNYNSLLNKQTTSYAVASRHSWFTQNDRSFLKNGLSIFRNKDWQSDIYRNYSKYWDTLNHYHTCSMICKSMFYYLLMCLKHCWTSCKLCRPWSDATFCGIWSGSTQFAKACLPQYRVITVVSVQSAEAAEEIAS